ncbi:lipoyl amidotransferase LIPT1, mitochondrial-like [Oscarella lobularis]|uniref:lipoyl amidotransferase LIPT1, mitochondrial-like n=1 Tax=Oscarella lobularis TaxID=121494 RepID=UPI0033134B75
MICFKSLSRSPHYNLALEEWLIANWNFAKCSILYLYENSPAIVIGRHQNPWLECNIPVCRKNHVDIVRRQSGGGTVYHDIGNVNLSFLTSKHEYKRLKNLEFIIRVLRNQLGIKDVTISPREDLMLFDRFKISGSASRITRIGAFHHCTLLLNVNSHKIKTYLSPKDIGIVTKATPSTRSPVGNLSQIASGVDFERISVAMASEIDCKVPENVDPTKENTYKGIGRIADKLKSWDWTFGKTPFFLIRGLKNKDCSLELQCRDGTIETAKITSPVLDPHVQETVEDYLQGCPLREIDLKIALQMATETIGVEINSIKQLILSAGF